MDADQLEAFWADVLSGNEGRVRTALDTLDPAARLSVIEHLGRMAAEPGWTDGQRVRARAALEAVSGPSRPSPAPSPTENNP